MRKLQDWIDYMEGECTPAEQAELRMLLKFSAADRLVLKNLDRLRRLIKLCDPADEISALLNNKFYMDRTHERIMAAVNTSESRELDPSPPQETYKR